MYFTRYPFPLPLAAFLWMIAILLFQRVAPERRFWIWMLPVVLVYSAAGLEGALRVLAGDVNKRLASQAVIIAVSVILLLGLGAAVQNYRAYIVDPVGDVEAVTLYFSDTLTDDDVVVISSHLSPPFWYYFLRYGMTDRYFFDIKNRTFQKAYVVVNAAEGETVAEAALARGNFGEVLELDAAERVYTGAETDVYVVPHR